MEEKNCNIEVLFPEFCNLFGDSQNITYLKHCMPNANFIDTSFDEEPSFVQENVDMIYLGPMTEKMQEKVIEKLRPFKGRIEELIDKGVVFLLTGNSIEILGEYIENPVGEKIDGLGIFKVHAKQDMKHRHNSFFIGNIDTEERKIIEIVGFKSQFTMLYGENEETFFAIAEKGIGINPQTSKEGIKKNHLIGTYLLGPILVLNPELTKEIMKMLGLKNPTLAYEKEVEEAYAQRVKEFKTIHTDV